MNAFETMLLFNGVTLVITAAAAIKRPILSYRLIVIVALCATGLSLQQVVTGRANPFTLWVTALLVAAMTRRIILNLGGMSRDKRR